MFFAFGLIPTLQARPPGRQRTSASRSLHPDTLHSDPHQSRTAPCERAYPPPSDSTSAAPPNQAQSHLLQHPNYRTAVGLDRRPPPRSRQHHSSSASAQREIET